MKTHELIKKVMALPTAPFREQAVKELVIEVLSQKKIPFYEDPYGNIIGGIDRPSELRGRARVGVMAHMDHPGFHLTQMHSPRRAQAMWYGGAPWRVMKGAKVRIYSGE